MSAAGLVLAAGRGTRFGGGKMLATFRGRPMLQLVLDAAAASRLDPVVVVLGADAARIDAAIDWRAERRLVNPDPGAGIAGSIDIGLRALADVAGVERVVVLLGDQPLVPVAAVERLLREPPDPARPIVVPVYADGGRGNPVLIERTAWPLAAALTGDRGMVSVIAARPHLVREVAVAGANPDIDTAAELDALNRAAEPGRSSRTEAAGRSRP